MLFFPFLILFFTSTLLPNQQLYFILYFIFIYFFYYLFFTFSETTQLLKYYTALSFFIFHFWCTQFVIFQLPNYQMRQLFFDFSAVVFCLGSCVLLSRQLFFDRSVVVFRQLCIASPAVVFWSFGSCFLTFRQLCFDRSAVVFWSFGSCFLPARQLFCAAGRIQ